jgi:hypothetical protein
MVATLVIYPHHDTILIACHPVINIWKARVIYDNLHIYFSAY